MSRGYAAQSVDLLLSGVISAMERQPQQQPPTIGLENGPVADPAAADGLGRKVADDLRDEAAGGAYRRVGSRWAERLEGLREATAAHTTEDRSVRAHATAQWQQRYHEAATQGDQDPARVNGTLGVVLSIAKAVAAGPTATPAEGPAVATGPSALLWALKAIKQVLQQATAAGTPIDGPTARAIIEAVGPAAIREGLKLGTHGNSEGSPDSGEAWAAEASLVEHAYWIAAAAAIASGDLAALATVVSDESPAVAARGPRAGADALGPDDYQWLSALATHVLRAAWSAVTTAHHAREHLLFSRLQCVTSTGSRAGEPDEREHAGSTWNTARVASIPSGDGTLGCGWLETVSEVGSAGGESSACDWLWMCRTDGAGTVTEATDGRGAAAVTVAGPLRITDLAGSIASAASSARSSVAISTLGAAPSPSPRAASSRPPRAVGAVLAAGAHFAAAVRASSAGAMEVLLFGMQLPHGLVVRRCGGLESSVDGGVDGGAPIVAVLHDPQRRLFRRKVLGACVGHERVSARPHMGSSLASAAAQQGDADDTVGGAEEWLVVGLRECYLPVASLNGSLSRGSLGAVRHVSSLFPSTSSLGEVTLAANTQPPPSQSPALVVAIPAAPSLFDGEPSAFSLDVDTPLEMSNAPPPPPSNLLSTILLERQVKGPVARPVACGSGAGATTTQAPHRLFLNSAVHAAGAATAAVSNGNREGALTVGGFTLPRSASSAATGFCVEMFVLSHAALYAASVAGSGSAAGARAGQLPSPFSHSVFSYGSKHTEEIFIEIASVDVAHVDPTAPQGARTTAPTGIVRIRAGSRAPRTGTVAATAVIDDHTVFTRFKGWLHLALNFTGTSWELLVNGVLMASEAAIREQPPVPPPKYGGTPGAAAMVGVGGGGESADGVGGAAADDDATSSQPSTCIIGRLFTGYVAEVRVWRFSRGPAVVRRDMHRQVFEAATDMELYMPLDEGCGFVVADCSPNGGHTLLISSAPTLLDCAAASLQTTTATGGGVPTRSIADAATHSSSTAIAGPTWLAEPLVAPLPVTAAPMSARRLVADFVPAVWASNSGRGVQCCTTRMRVTGRRHQEGRQLSSVSVRLLALAVPVDAQRVAVFEYAGGPGEPSMELISETFFAIPEGHQWLSIAYRTVSSKQPLQQQQQLSDHTTVMIKESRLLVALFARDERSAAVDPSTSTPRAGPLGEVREARVVAVTLRCVLPEEIALFIAQKGTPPPTPHATTPLPLPLPSPAELCWDLVQGLGDAATGALAAIRVARLTPPLRDSSTAFAAYIATLQERYPPLVLSPSAAVIDALIHTIQTTWHRISPSPSQPSSRDPQAAARLSSLATLTALHISTWAVLALPASSAGPLAGRRQSLVPASHTPPLPAGHPLIGPVDDVHHLMARVRADGACVSSRGSVSSPPQPTPQTRALAALEELVLGMCREGSPCPAEGRTLLDAALPLLFTDRALLLFCMRVCASRSAAPLEATLLAATARHFCDAARLNGLAPDALFGLGSALMTECRASLVEDLPPPSTQRRVEAAGAALTCLVCVQRVVLGHLLAPAGVGAGASGSQLAKPTPLSASRYPTSPSTTGLVTFANAALQYVLNVLRMSESMVLALQPLVGRGTAHGAEAGQEWGAAVADATARLADGPVGKLLPMLCVAVPGSGAACLAAVAKPLGTLRDALAVLLSAASESAPIASGKEATARALRPLRALLGTVGLAWSQAVCALTAAPRAVLSTAANADEDAPIRPLGFPFHDLFRGGVLKAGSSRDAALRSLLQGVGSIGKMTVEIQTEAGGLRASDTSAARIERFFMAALCASQVSTARLAAPDRHELALLFEQVKALRPWMLAEKQRRGQTFLEGIERKVSLLCGFEPCFVDVRLSVAGPGPAAVTTKHLNASDESLAPKPPATPAPAKPSTALLALAQSRGLLPAAAGSGAKGSSPAVPPPLTTSASPTTAPATAPLMSARETTRQWRRTFSAWKEFNRLRALVATLRVGRPLGAAEASALVVKFLQDDTLAAATLESQMQHIAAAGSHRLAGVTGLLQLVAELRIQRSVEPVLSSLLRRTLTHHHYLAGIEGCPNDITARIRVAHFQLLSDVLRECESRLENAGSKIITGPSGSAPWFELLAALASAPWHPADFIRLPVSAVSAVLLKVCEADGQLGRPTLNHAFPPWYYTAPVDGAHCAQSLVVGPSGRVVRGCGLRGCCLARNPWDPAYHQQMAQQYRDDDGTTTHTSIPPTPTAAAKGNKGVLPNLLYFEITIIDLGHNASLGIGAGPPEYNLSRPPGWDPGSVALHDDGTLFREGSAGRQTALSMGIGDVIGCGWDRAKGVLFFTKNGRDPAVEAPIPVRSDGGGAGPGQATVLCPIVGFDAKGIIDINFGHRPFLFSLAQRERETAVTSRAGQQHALSIMRERPLSERCWAAFQLLSLRTGTAYAARSVNTPKPASAGEDTALVPVPTEVSHAEERVDGSKTAVDQALQDVFRRIRGLLEAAHQARCAPRLLEGVGLLGSVLTAMGTARPPSSQEQVGGAASNTAPAATLPQLPSGVSRELCALLHTLLALGMGSDAIGQHAAGSRGPSADPMLRAIFLVFRTIELVMGVLTPAAVREHGHHPTSLSLSPAIVPTSTVSYTTPNRPANAKGAEDDHTVASRASSGTPRSPDGSPHPTSTTPPSVDELILSRLAQVCFYVFEGTSTAQQMVGWWAVHVVRRINTYISPSGAPHPWAAAVHALVMGGLQTDDQTTQRRALLSLTLLGAGTSPLPAPGEEVLRRPKAFAAGLVVMTAADDDAVETVSAADPSGSHVMPGFDDPTRDGTGPVEWRRHVVGSGRLRPAARMRVGDGGFGLRHGLSPEHATDTLLPAAAAGACPAGSALSLGRHPHHPAQVMAVLAFATQRPMRPPSASGDRRSAASVVTSRLQWATWVCAQAVAQWVVECARGRPLPAPSRDVMHTLAAAVTAPALLTRLSAASRPVPAAEKPLEDLLDDDAVLLAAFAEHTARRASCAPPSAAPAAPPVGLGVTISADGGVEGSRLRMAEELSMRGFSMDVCVRALEETSYDRAAALHWLTAHEAILGSLVGAGMAGMAGRGFAPRLFDAGVMIGDDDDGAEDFLDGLEDEEGAADAAGGDDGLGDDPDADHGEYDDDGAGEEEEEEGEDDDSQRDDTMESSTSARSSGHVEADGMLLHRRACLVVDRIPGYVSPPPGTGANPHGLSPARAVSTLFGTWRRSLTFECCLRPMSGAMHHQRVAPQILFLQRFTTTATARPPTDDNDDDDTDSHAAAEVIICAFLRKDTLFFGMIALPNHSTDGQPQHILPLLAMAADGGGAGGGAQSSYSFCSTAIDVLDRCEEHDSFDDSFSSASSASSARRDALESHSDWLRVACVQDGERCALYVGGRRVGAWSTGPQALLASCSDPAQRWQASALYIGGYPSTHSGGGDVPSLAFAGAMKTLAIVGMTLPELVMNRSETRGAPEGGSSTGSEGFVLDGSATVQRQRAECGLVLVGGDEGDLPLANRVAGLPFIVAVHGGLTWLRSSAGSSRTKDDHPAVGPLGLSMAPAPTASTPRRTGSDPSPVRRLSGAHGDAGATAAPSVASGAATATAGSGAAGAPGAAGGGPGSVVPARTEMLPEVDFGIAGEQDLPHTVDIPDAESSPHGELRAMRAQSAAAVASRLQEHCEAVTAKLAARTLLILSAAFTSPVVFERPEFGGTAPMQALFLALAAQAHQPKDPARIAIDVVVEAATAGGDPYAMAMLHNVLNALVTIAGSTGSTGSKTQGAAASPGASLAGSALAVLRALIVSLCGQLQVPPHVTVFESAHPCRSQHEPPREVAQPRCRFYDIFFDPRGTSGAGHVLLTFYTDHTLTNIVAQHTGYAFRIRAPRFFFDARLEGPGPQWGYRMSAVHGAQRQLTAARLLHTIAGAVRRLEPTPHTAAVRGSVHCPEVVAAVVRGCCASVAKNRRVIIGLLTALLQSPGAFLEAPMADGLVSRQQAAEQVAAAVQPAAAQLHDLRRLLDRQFRKELGLAIHCRVVQHMAALVVALRDAELCWSHWQKAPLETTTVDTTTTAVTIPAITSHAAMDSSAHAHHHHTHTEEQRHFSEQRARRRDLYAGRLSSGIERVDLVRRAHSDHVRIELTPDKAFSVWSESAGAAVSANVALGGGRWYYEVRLLGSGDVGIGASANVGAQSWRNAWVFNGRHGVVTSPNGARYVAPQRSWKAKDIIGVILDADHRRVHFQVNGADIPFILEYGTEASEPPTTGSMSSADVSRTLPAHLRAFATRGADSSSTSTTQTFGGSPRGELGAPPRLTRWDLYDGAGGAASADYLPPQRRLQLDNDNEGSRTRSLARELYRGHLSASNASSAISAIIESILTGTPAPTAPDDPPSMRLRGGPRPLLASASATFSDFPQTSSLGSRRRASDVTDLPQAGTDGRATFFPWFLLGCDEGISINFGASHFEFDLPRDCLPLDRTHLGIGTLIPFNQIRALTDVTAALCEQAPVPAFFSEDGDPFGTQQHRVGPPHVSMVAAADIVSSLTEVRNTGTAFATATTDCRVEGGGTWYYEVTLASQGLMQIGWGPPASDHYSDTHGAGDSESSWGLDLFRRCLWHRGRATPLPATTRRWLAGDTIGCALDLNARELHFTLNGREVIFGVRVDYDGPLSPAVSLRTGNSCIINFGSTAFRSKPDGFTALGVPDTWTERIDTYYATAAGSTIERRLQASRRLHSTSRRTAHHPTDPYARLVKATDQYCSESGKEVAQLSPEAAAAATRPLLTDDPPPLEELAKMFTTLVALARIARSAIPLLPVSEGADVTAETRLVRAARPYLLSQVREALVVQMLRETSCRSELFRITLNRSKAAPLDDNGRRRSVPLSATVFGQTVLLLADVHPRIFRCSKRFWTTSFAGEGAEDAGGPFRAHIRDMAAELMSGILPLFVPSPNNKHNVGEHRDAFVPAAGAVGPRNASLYRFVGRLMGGCLRSGEPFAVSFPPMVWRQLCQEPIGDTDIASFDTLCVQCAEEFRTMRDTYGDAAEEMFDDAFSTETFTTALSDGTSVELVPGGASRSVLFRDCAEYAAAMLRARRDEFALQVMWMREGLLSVIPPVILSLLTPAEVEVRVCGRPDYNVRELQEGATYEGLTADDRRVGFLWQALEAATPKQRRQFLAFVSGRERMPVKLRVLPFATAQSPDRLLPKAATCFFAIELPDYSTLEVMQARLYYAIENCAEIDTDFRAREVDAEEGPQLHIGAEERPDDNEGPGHTD